MKPPYGAPMGQPWKGPYRFKGSAPRGAGPVSRPGPRSLPGMDRDGLRGVGPPFHVIDMMVIPEIGAADLPVAIDKAR